MITDPQKFTSKITLYGITRFHFYHWNPFTVIPLAYTLLTRNLPKFYAISDAGWHHSVAGNLSPPITESCDTKPHRMQEVNSLCTDSQALRVEYCITAPHYASAIYAVIKCPSVRPSVCHMIVLYKMAKRRIMQTMPYDSPWTLVFWCQRYRWNSNKSLPNRGAKQRWVGSNRRFLINISLYLKNGARQEMVTM